MLHRDQEAAGLAMVRGTFPSTTTRKAPQNQLRELSLGKRFSWLPGNVLATACNEITTSFCTSVKQWKRGPAGSPGRGRTQRPLLGSRAAPEPCVQINVYTVLSANTQGPSISREKVQLHNVTEWDKDMVQLQEQQFNRNPRINRGTSRIDPNQH